MCSSLRRRDVFPLRDSCNCGGVQEMETPYDRKYSKDGQRGSLSKKIVDRQFNHMFTTQRQRWRLLSSVGSNTQGEICKVIGNGSRMICLKWYKLWCRVMAGRVVRVCTRRNRHLQGCSLWNNLGTGFSWNKQDGPWFMPKDARERDMDFRDARLFVYEQKKIVETPEETAIRLVEENVATGVWRRSIGTIRDN